MNLGDGRYAGGSTFCDVTTTQSMFNLCTCRTKCGRWQVPINNRDGRVSTTRIFFLQMTTATFRSTARPFDVDLVLHASYSGTSANKRTFTKKNHVHINVCLWHVQDTHPNHERIICAHIMFVLFSALPVDVCFFFGVYFFGFSTPRVGIVY